jgi:hypothetical protein
MVLRPEYPRPLLVRPRWRNLNGEWELGFDEADRGLRDGWEGGRAFEDLEKGVNARGVIVL